MAATSCFDWLCSRVRKAFRAPWTSRRKKLSGECQAELESVDLSIPTDETQHSPREHSFAHLQEEIASFAGQHPRKNSAPTGLSLSGFKFQPTEEGQLREEEENEREPEDSSGFELPRRPAPSQSSGSLPQQRPLPTAGPHLFDIADKSLIQQQEKILKEIENKKLRQQQEKPPIDLQTIASKSQASMSEVGLSQRQIDSIFTNTFDRARVQSEDPSQLECNICCTCYEDKSEIKILQCLHKYHKKCIDAWLSKKSTCPDCNFNQRVNMDQLV